MKRRAISFLTALALCLSLCPTWAAAADLEPDTGLCPHHRVHTEACGYVPPTPGQVCTHEHNENCFKAETLCVHQHTEDCYPSPDPDANLGTDGLEPSLCAHECSEESGCVVRTLDCPHVHDAACGYVPASAGALCTFVCRICPIEELIGALPPSVTPDNRDQVESQLGAILSLYAELTDGEQEQLELSRCFDLQAQLDAAGVPEMIANSDPDFDRTVVPITQNWEQNDSYEMTFVLTLDLQEYSYTVKRASAFHVQSTGALRLRGSGTVESKAGAGVQVETGGQLFVENSHPTVLGSTYALDIASGTTVQLSSGTYTGGIAAIQTADGNFAALLAPGCAYFDTDGKSLRPTDVAGKKTVIVKECTDHRYEYTHNPGTGTHTWTCTACGTQVASEPCTFDFDQNGAATCASCGAKIAVAVVRPASDNDLIYDGTEQPNAVEVTVTVDDRDGSTPLAESTDYQVAHTTTTNVGEVTITVTGLTYNGTFTKTYHVIKDQPVITWNTSGPVAVDYDGSPVDEATLLNHVTISTKSSENLNPLVQYSYRKKVDNPGDAAFTPGLPTNAGTYEIKASLPEQQNYTEAETATYLQLTIDKIPAVTTPPAAIPNLVYNGTAQELITAGEVQNGAVIEFAQEEAGPYSTTIPTGINAGEYEVWYRVADTENYTGVTETKITGVRIARKPITPLVELAYYTCLYDGGWKEPAVTVKDRDDQTVLPSTEYRVTYTDNQNVGTATVTVTDAQDGNYAITTVYATFKITLLTQDALSITDKPNTIAYGDQFTLSTSGGSGNGDVTWTITNGASVATVNPQSGQVTIKGVGSATVQATKSGRYNGATNYEDAIAVWSFNAEKKHVVAVVTAADKVYDEKLDATVTAALQSGDLVEGDVVTITNLSGKFESVGAGTNKKVIVNSQSPQIAGKNSGNYVITYPATTTASISKANVDETKVTAPKAKTNLAYTGSPQQLIEAGSSPDGTLEYSLDDITYSPTIPVETDAGTYNIWYRVKGDSNHNDTAGQKMSGTANIVPQDVPAPIIEFTPPSAMYDGNEKRPTVTVKDTNGCTIPEKEYTVTYGNTDWTAKGTHTVTVTDKANGNYNITETHVDFEILPAGQEPLSITNQPGMIYYGDTFTLNAVGGSGTGGIQWSINDDGKNIATIDPTGGLVKVLKSGGPVKVTATRLADGNHAAISTTWTFNAAKKPVTPIVTAKSREYDETDTAELIITWKDGDLLNGDTIPLTLTGTFDNANVGMDKTVTISGTAPNSEKYAITIPQATNASITKKTVVAGDLNGETLTYNGSEQALVKVAGSFEFSLAKEGPYSNVPPTGKNAGSYTVWYRVPGDDNHNESEPKAVITTISPKTVNSPTIVLSTTTFDYDGTEKRPTVVEVKDGSTLIPSSEYTVSYSNNILVSNNATVEIIDNDGGNYIVSGSTTFTINQRSATLIGTPMAKTLTYTGTAQELVTVGTAANGKVVYNKTGSTDTYSDTIPSGTDAGTYTVWYKVAGDTGYSDTTPQSVTVTIQPKPVISPAITLGQTSYVYSGAANEPVVTVYEFNGDVTPIADTEYSVSYRNNINAGTEATVVISNRSGGNYIVNGTATFTIEKATPNVSEAPTGRPNLMYNGTAQALIDPGSSTGGTMVYSLDGAPYSEAVPTGTAAGSYKISYKVLGDANHTDSAVQTLDPVTIDKNNDSPTVELSSNTFIYNGSEQKPTITLRDNNNNVIPENEYTVTYGSTPGDTVKVGSYQIIITSRGPNYSFEDITRSVTITAADQTGLTITNKPSVVYYGDTILLGTTGGSGNGEVTWKVVAGDDKVTVGDSAGQFKITGAGSITIKATRTPAEGSGYAAAEDSWQFTAQPKPIHATVTVKDKVYDKNTDAELTATVGNSELVLGDTLTLTATGTFDTADAGTDKTVTVTSVTVNGPLNGKYQVIYPNTIRGSITKATAEIAATPAADTDKLNYDGKSHALITTAGTTVNDIGVVEYSLQQDGPYSSTIPTGTAVGTYTIWYRVQDTNNYTGIGPLQGPTVEITGTNSNPAADADDTGSETSDTETTTAPPSSNASPVESASVPASVQNGSAVAVVNAAAARQLMRAAAASQSKNVVIKPEIAGDVTRAEVSIPAPAVSELKSGTNLTVSTPLADVTIPRAALDTLSGSGGAVSVVTEQVEHALAVTLSVDGEAVGSIPGGLTLAVPAGNAGPGTVAVLVHADGTRETIRKSVAENGAMIVPLTGSGTVEIVENSKRFTDVPATDWAADAVAFASARELFNGTSETTFSPALPMSRGMLATVLYNLEGCPEQDLTGGYLDVSPDAWYAAGVAWATAKGITNGYDSAHFGPDDSVTREQFAVMLWRYAGRPAEGGQALSFTDADQISDYAAEALRWAAANGILKGHGNGQLDPGGLATRAQAAQMLKNFIENP